MLRVSFEKPQQQGKRLLLTIMERESRRVVIMSNAIVLQGKEDFIEFCLCRMVPEDELFVVNVQLGSSQENISAYVNDSLDRQVCFPSEGDT